MKYSLKFNDLTSRQLGLLLHAVNEINAKYDPDKSNRLPEPEIVPQSSEPTQAVEAK